ncbi:MAG: hypothetical protein EA385_08100 [Salinarimonadaceae bacterium]|nr:MAG: hypothetical protein EA385_08100 [Salinarimonadaceae bacterium]
MSESKSLTTIEQADYEAIEGAVMETSRGRWFLAEYARRNRNADTRVLLDAIERIEAAVERDRETHEKDRLRIDLMEMARAISRTKTEIASIRPHQVENSELTVASEQLDAIVRTTERATSDILEAAEQVQEAAWTLRETGADEAICDELDRRATDIYTACSFQDLTAQRTSRIVQTLRYLEERINAMIDIWGSPAEEDAATDDTRRNLAESLDDFNGLCQTAIDDVILDDVAASAETYFLNDPPSSDPMPFESVDSDREIGVFQSSEPDDAPAAASADDVETGVDFLIDDDDDGLAVASVENAPGPLPELDALDASEKLRRFS